MAERATAASTAAAAQVEQKYHAALNILRTDIDRAKSAQSKAGGEASQAYTRIEKLGVNKKAATFIASLIKTETSIAEDVMRSVINLAQIAGMMPREDLVDLADRLAEEGTDGSQSADGGGDEDDDDAPNDEDDGGEPTDGTAAQVADAGKPHDTPDSEWDAAGEARAAKANVGERKSPAEARAERKRALRSVPEATGAAVH